MPRRGGTRSHASHAHRAGGIRHHGGMHHHHHHVGGIHHGGIHHHGVHGIHHGIHHHGIHRPIRHSSFGRHRFGIRSRRVGGGAVWVPDKACSTGCLIFSIVLLIVSLILLIIGALFMADTFSLGLSAVGIGLVILGAMGFFVGLFVLAFSLCNVCRPMEVSPQTTTTTDAVNPVNPSTNPGEIPPGYPVGYSVGGYPTYGGPYNTGDIQYGLPTEQPQPAVILQAPNYSTSLGAQTPSVFQPPPPQQQQQPMPNGLPNY